MKPFNFLLVATMDPFGYPPGVDPNRFRLVAAYDLNPAKWAALDWRNLYDPNGPSYRITTKKSAPVETDLVIVQGYRDALHAYRLHPEHKSQGSDGKRCGPTTRGRLDRRFVYAACPLHLIGKEANHLDEVQSGVVASIQDVVSDYTTDTGIDQLVLPVLQRYNGRMLARLTGVDRRTIDRVRRGSIPRPALATRLARLAVDTAAREVNATTTDSPAAILAAWRDRFGGPSATA